MKDQNDVAYKSPHDPPERQGGRLLNLGIICLSEGKGTTTTHIAVAPKKQKKTLEIRIYSIFRQTQILK